MPKHAPKELLMDVDAPFKYWDLTKRYYNEAVEKGWKPPGDETCKPEPIDAGVGKTDAGDLVSGPGAEEKGTDAEGLVSKPDAEEKKTDAEGLVSKPDAEEKKTDAEELVSKPDAEEPPIDNKI